MALQTIHEAVAAIGTAAGIDRLALDGNGSCKLVIDDLLEVFVTEVSDDELEIQAYVDGIGPNLSDAEMQAMFEVNMSLRTGRLALDDATGRVVFGTRLRIGVYATEPDFVSAVNDFMVEAVRWNTAHVTGLKEKAQAVAQGESVLSETFIRV